MAHHIFGVAQTINSANYVYFLALEKLLTLDHPMVTTIYMGTEDITLLNCATTYAEHLLILPCVVNCASVCTMAAAEQMLMLHQGQGLDIYWRDSYTCPTEDEYFDMVLKSMSFITLRSRHSYC